RRKRDGVAFRPAGSRRQAAVLELEARDGAISQIGVDAFEELRRHMLQLDGEGPARAQRQRSLAAPAAGKGKLQGGGMAGNLLAHHRRPFGDQAALAEAPLAQRPADEAGQFGGNRPHGASPFVLRHSSDPYAAQYRRLMRPVIPIRLSGMFNMSALHAAQRRAVSASPARQLLAWYDRHR